MRLALHDRPGSCQDYIYIILSVIWWSHLSGDSIHRSHTIVLIMCGDVTVVISSCCISLSTLSHQKSEIEALVQVFVQ